MAFTIDHAVAVSVSYDMEAVILDEEMIRDDEWSVACTMKMARPTLRILLFIEDAVERAGEPPCGIDAFVSRGSHTQLREELAQFLPSGRR